MLFEFLTGDRLVRLGDLSEMLNETARGRFRSVAEVRPGTPHELSAFVAKAVEDEPAKRPSLADWALVMQRFGGCVLPLPGPPKNVGEGGQMPIGSVLHRPTSVLTGTSVSSRLRLRSPRTHGAVRVSWPAEWLEPALLPRPGGTNMAAEEREFALDLGNLDLSELFPPPSEAADMAKRKPEQDRTPGGANMAEATQEEEGKSSGMKPAEGPRPYLDENVQFTVYRPAVVRPMEWHTLLAFAHLSERPPDAPPEELSPIEEVKRQAEQALGEKVRDYRDVTQDSLKAVPREGEITFKPEIPGVEFNPPSRSFLWLESVHREDFRLRASAELDGQTARGRLTVFLGSVILADIPLAIRVDSRVAAKAAPPPREAVGCRPYRRIFASYSHKDVQVVEEFERYAAALGDSYLRDWVHLRAGEVWSDRLGEMIDEADVFQLFWSRNSMGSPFVKQEWEHALALGRPHFVRPCYWEEPLPEDPEKGLPPDALRRLHFQRILACGGAHLPPAPLFETARGPGTAVIPICAVIGEIRAVVASKATPDKGRLIELATSYLQACEIAKAKALRCRELLRQGMREEAIRLAKEAPALQEAADVLSFDGHAAWLSLCEEVGIELRQFGFSPEVVARVLTELSTDTDEDSLNRLLEKQRLLALGRAPLAARIQVLRRIARADPADLSWREDLRALETARLGELAHLVREALAARDRPALEAMREELNSTAWLTPPPKALLLRVEDAPKPSMESDVRQRYAELGEQLRHAHASFDADRCRDLLAQWHQVEQEAGVAPDATAAHDALAIEAWLKELDEAASREQEFRASCSALEAALDGNAALQALEARAAAVLRHGQGMPRPLATRYDARMAALERPRCMRTGLVFAAVAVLVTAVLWLLHWLGWL